MKARVRDLWADALDSGKYEQTLGALHDGTGHCCLGVLCEVAMQQGVALDLAYHKDLVGCAAGVWSYDDHTLELPRSVLVWADIEDSTPKVHWLMADPIRDADFASDDGFCEGNLVEMNDSDWTFHEIADRIRRGDVT